MKSSLNIFVAFALLAACASPEKDWELARRDDSRNAYLEFLAKYPDSPFAEPARQRVRELKVIRAWDRAEFKDSLVGYQAFVDKHGDSEYADIARTRARDIQRDEQWQRIRSDGGKRAAEAFLAQYPDAPQAVDVRSMLAEIFAAEEAAKPKERPGNFRLQLAAFQTAAAAEQELRRLVALVGESLTGPIRIESPVQSSVSRMFLLKSVPMTGDEARDTCATLKNLGQACLIINR